MADFAPLPAGYDDTNRAFLQALMARGSMTFEEAQPILAALFSVKDRQEVETDSITVADLDSYISAASAAISPFDYEIRSTQHQTTKERHYAIVNSTSDAMTQLATTRTADEIAFINRVLDAMFETYNTQRSEIMAISSMQAIKVARPTPDRRVSLGVTQLADQGLTNSQAEKLMKSLVDEGWMERSAKGYYTLSPRALMELKGWLVASYNDLDEPDDAWQHVKNCYACKQIITVGERCAKWDCNVRLHSTCAKPYWRQRGDVKCPECETQWGKCFVGEKALIPQARAGKAGPGERRSGRAQVDGAGSGGEDAERDDDGQDGVDEEQDAMVEDDE